MKKIGLYTLLALIFVSVLFALRPSSKVQKDLLLAEKLMTTSPDSSLRVLKEMNTKYFSSENKALYALLMTQAKFKNRQPENSDSLIDIAVDYYKEGKDSLRKAQSYFYRGRVEENMGNAKEALTYYQRALVAALPTDNYNLSGLICNYWGLLLQRQYLFDDAFLMLKESLKYSELSNDTIGQMFVLKEIGKNCSLNKEFDRVLDYYNPALHFAKLIGNKACMSEIYNNLGIVYKCKQEYDSAIFYVNKSILLRSDSALVFSGFLVKGDLFSLQQQYDSARYYLNMGKRNNDIISKATYCFFMSALEERVGNYKDALDYSNQYVAYIDTIENSKRESVVAELQKKYEYSLMENENAKLELEKKNRDVAILSIFMILIVAIWGYTYRYNKIRREKDLLVKAGQEQLRQMTDKLVVRQIELDQFRQKTKADMSELREWVLTRNDVMKKINRLNQMTTNERIANAQSMKITDKESENLLEVVNTCFDNFAVRLVEHFPRLKDDNVQFCCLLKMKVPINIIAILVDLDEASLVKRKYRLKKNQMELSEGYSSLEDFLLNF